MMNGMKYNATLRNILGDLGILVLAIFINLLAIPVVILIEGYQCGWGKKFAWEYEDIFRRVIASMIGAAIQIALVNGILYG